MADHDLLTHHFADIGGGGLGFKFFTSFLQSQEHKVELKEKLWTKYPLGCGMSQVSTSMWSVPEVI